MDKSEKKDIISSESERKDIIFGKNAVMEALKSGRAADSLLVARGADGASLSPIIARCREAGVVIKESDNKKLDSICGNKNHQGLVLFIAAREYGSIDDMLELAKQRNEPPFIVICDSIEDPHNLGALIRTAEAAGVHGIIIPQRRSASLSATVAKTSAGALEYMPVAKVVNLNSAISELKNKGLWIYAADMDGEPYTGVDFSGPLALVIGSEGKGLSRLVRENADVTVSIPMRGKINSLNASVAGGIFMFEIAKKRN